MRRFFIGFSKYKYWQIKHFFRDKGESLFVSSGAHALSYGVNRGSELYLWGASKLAGGEDVLRAAGVNVYRVEDGFLRSFHSNPWPGKIYSLVIDGTGIHFDPTSSSDLESRLLTGTFEKGQIRRAQDLISNLRGCQLTKYSDQPARMLKADRKRSGPIILVPGQVDDGWSVQLGGCGQTSISVLAATRWKHPDAHIIYKISPDLISHGQLVRNTVEKASRYADQVALDVSADSCLALCDEVHTVTSLIGFEALIRGKRVVTYGLPFYAGWGLTIDQVACKRRGLKRTVDELVYAALIEYPKYVGPITKDSCEVEQYVNELVILGDRINRANGMRFIRNAVRTLIPRLPGFRM